MCTHAQLNCLRYCLNCQATQANFPHEIGYCCLPFSQGSLCPGFKMASCVGSKRLIKHSLFQALGQWGQSKKRAGNKQDQRRPGSGREKERVGEPASILLNFIPPKRNCFLCRNVRCQNLHIFGIPMISLSQPALRQPYITSQSNALFSVVFIMVDSRNNFFANSQFSNMADFHFQGCRHLEYANWSCENSSAMFLEIQLSDWSKAVMCTVFCSLIG